MKKILFLAITALLFSCKTVSHEKTIDNSRISDEQSRGKITLCQVGEGYSSTSVNNAVFRNSALATLGDVQVIAFYDPEGWLVLGKRKLNDKAFTLKRTQYQGNVRDAHNVISIMIDGEGYIHASFDHHGHPLKYCRSIAPFSLELGDLEPMTGDDEQDVTYPEFYRLADGGLLFAYRSGASGRGNLVLNKYNLSTHAWERVQNILIDGENQRNAYWQLFVDAQGTIHVSWVWRETWMVETNHDLCYARSRDNGVTWEKTTGEKYTLPITKDNAEYACLIPQESELINQTSMSTDPDGHPFIATYWRDQGDSIPQYRMVWHDGERWNQQTVSRRRTPFSLKGGGTKMIPISRPRVAVDGLRAYYIFRDEERDSRVSMFYTDDIRSGRWQTVDLTDFPVHAWEPNIDTELWKSQRRLHIFVQDAYQGDGETTVESEPAMIHVLEVLPPTSFASIGNLLPTPRQIENTGETLPLGGKVRLTDPTGNLLLSQFLTDCGFSVSPKARTHVTVEILPEIEGLHDYEVDGIAAEGYALSVGQTGIHIRALSALGVSRAAATLMQLAEGCNGRLPGVEILDYPSFKVRGYMLDIGRSFISLSEIKHEIDLLARFKINYFHWHLTENQAWRFEVRRYPQLTDPQFATRDEGQFYSQADCREVIDYAKARGVLVVPEIDMPGHSEAFTRAMGFKMSTDEGIEVLKNVLDEVAEVFRESPYIHIGADETSVSREFVQTMTAHIHKLGKKAMTWNPINMEVSAENGIDACQLWSTRGTYSNGMMNIDSKYNYANLHDMFADLAGVFNSNVYYSAEGTSDLSGAVACVWTDRLMTNELDYIGHNNFWALMLANAERLWCGGRTRYLEEAGASLQPEGAEFNRFADWERRFLHYKQTWLSEERIPYVKQTDIRWRFTEPVNEDFTGDVEQLPSRVAAGATVYLRHAWHPNIPAFVNNPKPSTVVYAWTNIYSPEEQDAGAIIETQTYERSWHDTAPEPGQWDFRGTEILLNGEPLKAPDWNIALQPTNFETLLTDENWTMRPPLRIHLKQGWNKLLIRLPFKDVPSTQIRLNRWMWTFVVTTPDGRNALPGIKYSVEK